MPFLHIPRAEHDFMYVSTHSDTLMTFWLIEDNGSIASFAYLIGVGNTRSKCSYIAIRSDNWIAFSHYGDDMDNLEFVSDTAGDEVEEFVEAYRIWKQEIEMILLGEEVML